MIRNYSFLKSALTSEGVEPTSKVIEWLAFQNQSVHVAVERTALRELKNWHFSNGDSNLRHQSGKFFSIDGIRVQTNWGNVPEWDQPIINQPEVGILGFITQEINGVLHFLMQAKIEPGNVNCVQLSPTLQATRSNYTQIHQGNKPFFLDYFLQAKPANILLDQLQSEQGGRFLRKRNRNIIISVSEPLRLPANFIWLTLGQIKSLMAIPNLINMDTRTVISGITFDGLTEDDYRQILETKRINPTALGVDFFRSTTTSVGAVHSIEEIITFLTAYKSTYDLLIERVPLIDLRRWQIKADEIVHEDGKYFKIIGVNVEIDNREVIKWSQPMVMPSQEGICAFIVKKINGTMHFLMQAKLECGNHDIIEFAPTVQCLTGNYREAVAGPPFLEFVLHADAGQRLYDTYQSEEGGRFYLEQNRNLIVLADDAFSEALPEKYIWMTLQQLQVFLKFNNYLNIQARSLIAAITYQ